MKSAAYPPVVSIHHLLRHLLQLDTSILHGARLLLVLHAPGFRHGEVIDGIQLCVGDTHARALGVAVVGSEPGMAGETGDR